MSGLISLIVEFLASVAAAAKARQQAKAAEELPRGDVEVKVITDDVTAIRAEMTKLAEPPVAPSPPKPVTPTLPN